MNDMQDDEDQDEEEEEPFADFEDEGGVDWLIVGWRGRRSGGVGWVVGGFSGGGMMVWGIHSGKLARFEVGLDSTLKKTILSAVLA